MVEKHIEIMIGESQRKIGIILLNFPIQIAFTLQYTVICAYV